MIYLDDIFRISMDLSLVLVDLLSIMIVDDG